jgi:hypothetical protein
MSAISQILDAPPPPHLVQTAFRLQDVLAFAEKNLRSIETNSSHWTTKGDEFVTFSDKIVLETSLLLLLAARVAKQFPPMTASIIQLATMIAPRARSERVRAMLQRFPHTAVSLGIPHLVLTRLGYEDKEFDDLVSELFDSGTPFASERVPFRIMDARWVHALQNATSKSDFFDVVSISLLGSRTHAIYMSRTDAYALTHAVMYATDFGLRPLPKGVDLSRVASLIDSAVAWNLDAVDFDLLGELLIAAIASGLPPTPHTIAAWEFLHATWAKFGFLPSPTFRASTFDGLADDAKRAYSFEHTYHTTYVAGMLCALLLNMNREHPWQTLACQPCEYPSIDRVVLAKVKNCVLRLGQFLEVTAESMLVPTHGDSLEEGSTSSRPTPSVGSAEDAPGGDWWDWCRSTSVLKDAEAAHITYDIAIIHAARSYDLPRLVIALCAAIQAGIFNATVEEGLRFLCRQQVPNGALGCHFLKAQNVFTVACHEANHFYFDQLNAALSSLDSDFSQ